MTFGFRNLNGSAIQIKLVQTPTGRFPSARTVQGLRRHVIRTMNKYGRRAVKVAKSPGHSPRKTGALVNSIKWRKAVEGRVRGRVITGALEVGVPYGRRQEFEHNTKRLYLQRALRQVFPEYLAELRNKKIVGDVLFARRRQTSVRGSVRGGFF